MIVLDTSYSIDENLAKRFISNTYSILSTSNMFYKSCKVHIIQCDDRIRKDDVISNQNEMDRLFEFIFSNRGEATLILDRYLVM